MDFNTYQKKAHETALYKGVDDITSDANTFDLIDEEAYRVYAPIYPFLKLAQEASEVTEPILKHRFRGDMKEIAKEDLAKELGDTLWYISECATQLGISLEDIARMNLLKLGDRAKRNTIKGSGDDR